MSSLHCKHDLTEILAGAQLPALPQSAVRLLELSQDPENGPNEFAVPIEADPGLTGQVLRFVNSSYFGFSREVSSISLAINLVGIRTIKNFALWSAVFSLMPNPRCGPFDLRSLWQDSLRRGLFARRLGKQLHCADFEDLFAASLLQDMAIPLLAKALPDQYYRLLESRDEGRRRLSDLEMKEFGWTHAEAGATIAAGWNLPKSFATVIEGHASLEAKPGAPAKTPAELIVALSAMLPASTDAEWGEGLEFVWAYQQLISEEGSDIWDAMQAVDDDFDQFAPMMKLAIPSVSLVQHLDRLPEEED